jgi:uncharacterized Zn-finger protein
MKHPTTEVDGIDEKYCQHFSLHLDVEADGIYACTACGSRFTVR